MAAVKNLGQCILSAIQQASVKYEGRRDKVFRKLWISLEYYDCKEKESSGQIRASSRGNTDGTSVIHIN